ncbi:acyl-CoA N-acyltransferase [Tricladium varicosporioides]|nr:acyl-CoA N-acyltransferase [Hymenoscyphus varicosporioides]
MASETVLFSTSLISPEVQTALPIGYACRPLQRTDFQRGHLHVLRDLAHVSDITEEKWVERFDWMNGCNGSYFVVVIVDEKREAGKQIVATATLLIEKKFLNNLGIQGHIEDVVVAADQRGKHFGILLIQALDYIGEKVGCYKNILDCRPEKEAFYEKCGYEKRGTEMHRYLDTESVKHGV